jgi:hypothetical protein
MEVEIFCIVGIIITVIAATKIVNQEDGTMTFAAWAAMMLGLILSMVAAYEAQLLY